MRNSKNAAILVAALTLLSGCAAGVVVDTTASVVGGVVDGVVTAAEWTADLVTD